MRNTTSGDCSAFWTKPKRDTNDCLFLDSVSQLLAALEVGAEEMEDWQRRGWVSFNHRLTRPISSPLCSEVEFIRNLACSGLPYSQIDEMLRSLKRPYQYNPELVAFHPRYGWVSPRRQDAAEDEAATSEQRSRSTRRIVRRMKCLEQQLRLLMDEIASL